MTLLAKKYSNRFLDVEAMTYATSVPFYKPFFVCEHTLDSNDTIIPLVVSNPRDSKYPVPGYTTVYRLIGDGVHSPTFTGFNKASGSENYDITLAAVNLVTFFFDGVDYWYTITLVA